MTEQDDHNHIKACLAPILWPKFGPLSRTYTSLTCLLLLWILQNYCPWCYPWHSVNKIVVRTVDWCRVLLLNCCVHLQLVAPPRESDGDIKLASYWFYRIAWSAFYLISWQKPQPWRQLQRSRALKQTLFWRCVPAVALDGKDDLTITDNLTDNLCSR